MKQKGTLSETNDEFKIYIYCSCGCFWDNIRFECSNSLWIVKFIDECAVCCDWTSVLWWSSSSSRLFYLNHFRSHQYHLVFPSLFYLNQSLPHQYHLDVLFCFYPKHARSSTSVSSGCSFAFTRITLVHIGITSVVVPGVQPWEVALKSRP